MSFETVFQILTVGGLAGVISALFGGALREYFESLERKRKARHLSLKISISLEDYYHTCVNQIYSIVDYRNSGGSAGNNDAGLPELKEYPDDPTSWTYLYQSVADEVLNFREIILSRDDISRFNAYADNNPDGPDLDPTLEALYEMAFMSIKLAKYIRSKYELPKLVRTRNSERRLRAEHEEFMVNMSVRQEKSWRSSEKIISLLEKNVDNK